MSTRKSVFRAFFVLLIVLLISGTASASPLNAVSAGTGFTYQGKLSNGGVAVTAQCDFQFGLWDALTVGTQVGATQTKSNVSVVSGLFTTQLDFGTNAFNGDARWLEMAVRCPAGSGSYTLLTPRQPLTPAPMALALPGLYTQQNATSPNLIGGYSGNIISPGVVGGTIGGGGSSSYRNSVLKNFGTISGGMENTVSGTSQGGATVGGGWSNTASGDYATVGGGWNNLNSGQTATISGGRNNLAMGEHATVGGGYNNTASAFGATIGGGSSNTSNASYSVIGGGTQNYASGAETTIAGGYGNSAGGTASTVGGGNGNTASGEWATIPGGNSNMASMPLTFAAGYRAKAIHKGTFIWADSTSVDFTSTGDDQFLVRATGGVGINTTNTTANNLTVNGQIIGGGTGVPTGSYEPIISRGSNSGISLDDRNNILDRWVIYPTGGALRFFNNGDRVSIDSAGVLAIGGLGSAGGTALCRNASNQIAICSSSQRYKNNIKDLNLGLDIVAQLRPVTFDWKDSGAHDLGFVAEEVEKVTPLLTTRNADGQIEGVKYDRISAVLVNAINEQQDQIADLKSQNAALEARITALEQMSNTAVRTNSNKMSIPWLGFGGLLVAGVFLMQRRRGGAQ